MLDGNIPTCLTGLLVLQASAKKKPEVKREDDDDDDLPLVRISELSYKQQ
jgi:hypothetical protein